MPDTKNFVSKKTFHRIEQVVGPLKKWSDDCGKSIYSRNHFQSFKSHKSASAVADRLLFPEDLIHQLIQLWMFLLEFLRIFEKIFADHGEEFGVIG